MFYSSSETRSLPVVRYSRGFSRPGASHAALPNSARVRLPKRALTILALLAALAVMATFRPAPPVMSISTRPVAQTKPITAPRHAARWDTRLDAAPHKGQFVRFFRMKATAYAPINTRMEGGRYTSTLRDGRSAHGVAVDPDLIPLGSHLWIPGYGHAVADDIGGAIQGHHVDVRVQVPGHMGRWGVRPVRVYVLQEPRKR